MKYFKQIDREDALIFGGLVLIGVGGLFIHPALFFASIGLGLFLLGTGIIKIK